MSYQIGSVSSRKLGKGNKISALNLLVVHRNNKAGQDLSTTICCISWACHRILRSGSVLLPNHLSVSICCVQCQGNNSNCGQLLLLCFIIDSQTWPTWLTSIHLPLTTMKSYRVIFNFILRVVKYQRGLISIVKLHWYVKGSSWL